MFSEDLRAKIRVSYAQFQNYRQVGRNFGVSHQTVKYIVSNQCNEQKKRRGPERKLGRHEEMAINRVIRKSIQEGVRISGKIIQQNCNLDHVSDRTARRTMSRIGFKYKIIKQSLLLTQKHKLRRVELAKNRLESQHPW